MAKNKKPGIWFGIDENYEIKAYKSNNKKLNVAYWIYVENTGDSYTSSYGNTQDIYRYKVYDNNFNPTEIEINGWKIHKIYDPKQKHAYQGTYAVFIDPYSEIRTEMIYEIDRALKYLQEISRYNNWENYDLKNSNDKLNQEIETLKEDRDKLYSMVYAFKNTKLYNEIIQGYERMNEHPTSEKEIQIFCNEFKINELFIENFLITD